MKIILAILLSVLICGAVFAGYVYHEDQVRKEEEKKAQIEELERQLNETQENLEELNSQKSSSSSSSSQSVSSSDSNKVTYEEAGVDKNIGYMKKCKYPGCGAVYNSKLAYCPKCGQKNIYV